MNTDEQQFPLSTAKIASCFYPALGRADARNEGGESRPPRFALPSLRSPIAGIIFYENYFFIRVI